MIELVMSCALYWHTQFLPPAGWVVEKIDPQYSNITSGNGLVITGGLTISSGGSIRTVPSESIRDGRETPTPRIRVTMRRTVALKERVDMPTSGECTNEVGLK